MTPISVAVRDDDGHRIGSNRVPCGKCYSCLSNRRNQWTFRINQELKQSYSAFFITLSYEDEKLDFSPDGLAQLNKRHVQLFLKRLRRSYGIRCKDINYDVKKPENDKERAKIRYYIVGEYGPKTERPHYHGIFFNLPLNPHDMVLDAWNNGHIVIGDVTQASIHYVAGYIIQRYEDYGKRTKPFALISGKPGIGCNYLSDEIREWHKSGNRFYATYPGGIRSSLPRYYSDKIFTEDERIQNSSVVESIRVIRERDERSDLYRRGEIQSELEYHHYKHAQSEQFKENFKKTKTKNKSL